MLAELVPYAIMLLVGAAGARTIIERSSGAKERRERWAAFASSRGLAFRTHANGLPQLRGTIDGVDAVLSIEEVTEASARRAVHQPTRERMVLTAGRAGTTLCWLHLIRRSPTTELLVDDVDPGDDELRGALVVRARSAAAFLVIARDAALREALLALPPDTEVVVNDYDVRIRWWREQDPQVGWAAAELAARVAKLEFDVPAPERGGLPGDYVEEGFMREWARVAAEWRAFADTNDFVFRCDEQRRRTRALPWLEATVDGVRVQGGLIGPDDAHLLHGPPYLSARAMVRAERLETSPLDLTIRRRSIASRVASILDPATFAIGDEAFDAAVIVAADDEAKGRALLADPEVRAAIVALDLDFTVRVEGATVRVVWDDEIAPAAAWRAAPVVAAIARVRTMPGSGQAYR